MTAVLPAVAPSPAAARIGSPRHYLMCRPEHFAVTYAINPWMDAAVPVDPALALRQWETLRQTYLGLGHRVDVIEPEPGLPDMVFAANGGLVFGGRALGARFTHPERRPEGPAYQRWFQAAVRNGELKEAVVPVATNEGRAISSSSATSSWPGTGSAPSRPRTSRPRSSSAGR